MNEPADSPKSPKMPPVSPGGAGEGVSKFGRCPTTMFARIEVVICTFAFAMLLLASGLNRQPLIYDEPHRLEVVDVLREKGFSRDFLEQMPHATGPLTPAARW